ncbi:MAG: hypothetical protein D6702_02210 [Planctomycetota bacterium]|nr:MAG: hypothetical protein D6702_02210 [Planctomycetota bacterium]
MRGLVRADLQQLGNLFRTQGGRRLLILLVLAQAMFLAMGGMAGPLLDSPDVVVPVREGRTDPALVFGLLLVPTLLLMLRIASGGGPRQLLTGPELPLLFAAPCPSLLLAARGLWRQLAQVLFWCLGFLSVAVFLGTATRIFPPAALARLPLALILMAAPLLASVQAVYVLAMRFAPTRATQAGFALLGFAAILVFFLLVTSGPRIVGAGARPGAGPGALLAALEGGRWWPLLLRAPARFVVHGWTGSELLTPFAASLGLTLAGLGLATVFLRRAWENAIALADRSRSRGSRRRWPAGLVASLLRKEWLALSQQPARLLGICLSAGLLGWLSLQSRDQPLALTLPEPGAGPWLDALARGGAVIGLAAKLSIFLLPSFGLSVFQGEAAQWPLIAASPADRRAFLVAKSGAALFLLAPYLVVALALGLHAGLAWTDLLVVAGLGPPALAALVAPLLAFGCSPLLLRPEDAGRLVPRIRTGLGLAVVYPVLLTLLAAGWGLWTAGAALLGRFGEAGPALFAAVWWAACLLVVAGAWRRARRNAERYFGPRP